MSEHRSRVAPRCIGGNKGNSDRQRVSTEQLINMIQQTGLTQCPNEDDWRRNPQLPGIERLAIWATPALREAAKRLGSLRQAYFEAAAEGRGEV
jgi:hypothetical protein